MNHSLRISEAASLALHSMVMLAARPDRPLSTREVAEELRVSEAHLSKVFQRLARAGLASSTREVAEELHVSEAHLSKVFQRLAKAGLVNSTRGPHGGFVLARDAHGISLLEVYETIDGPICAGDCLLGEPACEGQACIMGDLVKSINDQMRRYLADTHLDQVTKVYAKRRPVPVPA